MEREKIFANYVSDKRLISIVYKEHVQLNNKKSNNLILKTGKGLESTFCQRRSTKANEDGKSCLMSVIIREMQIKTISPHINQDGYNQKNKCWRTSGENWSPV